MKIEKIEMPKPVKKVDVFREMEVGDSILDPDGFEASPKGSKWYASAQQFSVRFGGKFSARAVEGGIRIWRVK